jgi:hypothetical protein
MDMDKLANLSQKYETKQTVKKEKRKTGLEKFIEGEDKPE